MSMLCRGKTWFGLISFRQEEQNVMSTIGWESSIMLRQLDLDVANLQRL